VFTFYLLTRDRHVPAAVGALPANPPAATATTAQQ
jgi:hypothetical protein